MNHVMVNGGVINSSAVPGLPQLLAAAPAAAPGGSPWRCRQVRHLTERVLLLRAELQEAEQALAEAEAQEARSARFGHRGSEWNHQWNHVKFGKVLGKVKIQHIRITIC